MQKRLLVLRRLLLCAGFFAGLLLFWLPAHEVFEGPKTFAFLIYSSLLAALSLPLFAGLPARFLAFKGPLIAAGALLLASLASLLGALFSLPGNLLLCVEKLAPLSAGALSALVFLLEEEETRKRVLFSLFASHALLILYGLIQLIDQNLGQPLGQNVDMIRWTSFGPARVYSTMGNPDYMAAQLTLFLPLWLGLGWQKTSPRPVLKLASLLLMALPIPIVVLAYGARFAVFREVFKSWWVWSLICLGAWYLARRLSARATWLALAYLQVLLIMLAQGRGAQLGLVLSAFIFLALAAKQGGAGFFAAHKRFFRGNALALGLVFCAWGGLHFLKVAKPDNALVNWKPLRLMVDTGDSLLGRIKGVFDSNSDSSFVRLFYYKSALRMGLQHPLFGVGFGNHAMFTARAQSEIWKKMEAGGSKAVYQVEPHVELYTHNDFIQNFAETGVLGLAAFLYFWWFFASKAWLLAGSEPWPGSRSRFGISLLSFAGAFFVSAMVNFPWRVLASQQIVWLAFALLALKLRPESEGAEAHPKTREAAPHPGLLAGGMLAAFILALWPARWFFSSCLFRQGNAGRDSKNWAYAERFYSKAVVAGLSGTQRVELLLYLGSSYNELGNPAEAEKWFQKGLEIYPDFIEALYNLGYTYMTRNTQTHLPEDAKKALEYFQRVLDINPRYGNALNILANYHYNAHQFPEAAKYYESYLRFSPDNADIRYYLGAVYLWMGRSDDAKAQLEQVLKLNPKHPQAGPLYEQIRKYPKGAVIKLQ